MRLTMVKRAEDGGLFEAAFDLAFPARDPAAGGGRAPRRDPEYAPGSGPGSLTAAAPDLLGRLVAALRSDSAMSLDALATDVVAAFGGLDATAMPPAGAAGSSRYHYYRVLRQLDVSALLQRSMRLDGIAALGPLQRRVAAAAGQERLEEFRVLLGAELRRRLAEINGLAASLEQLRDATLDVEFLRAGPAELAAMRDAVRPLARRLAAKAGRRARLRATGRLDMRRTMRRALSTGGVPVYPALRRRHRSRPHLLVLCDVSGSVAEFAKFTLSLLHALHAELPRLRSFVFVDGPHEITDLVETSPGVIDTRLLLSRPGVVRDDGHSDYGATLDRFIREYGSRLAPETTLIVCGDARSNYRPPQTGAPRHARDPGAPHLLAQSRAARGVGHQGLGHVRVRAALHGGGRGQDPRPAKRLGRNAALTSARPAAQWGLPSDQLQASMTGLGSRAMPRFHSLSAPSLRRQRGCRGTLLDAASRSGRLPRRSPDPPAPAERHRQPYQDNLHAYVQRRVTDVVLRECGGGRAR